MRNGQFLYSLGIFYMNLLPQKPSLGEWFYFLSYYLSRLYYRSFSSNALVGPSLDYSILLYAPRSEGNILAALKVTNDLVCLCKGLFYFLRLLFQRESFFQLFYFLQVNRGLSEGGLKSCSQYCVEQVVTLRRWQSEPEQSGLNLTYYEPFLWVFLVSPVCLSTLKYLPCCESQNTLTLFIIILLSKYYNCN